MPIEAFVQGAHGRSKVRKEIQGSGLGLRLLFEPSIRLFSYMHSGDSLRVRSSLGCVLASALRLTKILRSTALWALGLRLCAQSGPSDLGFTRSDWLWARFWRPKSLDFHAFTPLVRALC